MAHTTVGRWGKNLAVRFPAEIATASGIREGEQVDIDTWGDEIVIRRVAPRFTLDDLFRGRSPEEWRAEYAAAFDWGLISAGRRSKSDRPGLFPRRR